jgi:hypothetical protein
VPLHLWRLIWREKSNSWLPENASTEQDFFQYLRGLQQGDTKHRSRIGKALFFVVKPKMDYY